MSMLETKQRLIEACKSLNMDMLDALTKDQIWTLDATDLRWCKDWASGNYGSFDSEEEAISLAICAMYEEITNE